MVVMTINYELSQRLKEDIFVVIRLPSLMREDILKRSRYVIASARRRKTSCECGGPCMDWTPTCRTQVDEV